MVRGMTRIGSLKTATPVVAIIATPNFCVSLQRNAIIRLLSSLFSVIVAVSYSDTGAKIE